MDASLAEFERHRPRLRGIAYRMLGLREDSDDVLQEAYIRWQEVRPADLENAEAWLVRVVTRLCIDQLRVLRRERENYSGPWLPEPVPEVGPESAVARFIALKQARPNMLIRNR